jgi:RNase P protein component
VVKASVEYHENRVFVYMPWSNHLGWRHLNMPQTQPDAERPNTSTQPAHDLYAQHLLGSAGAELDISQDVLDASCQTFADMHKAYEVLTETAEGDKPGAATLIRAVMGLQGNCAYAMCISEFAQILTAEGDSTFIVEHNLGPAEDETEDEADEEPAPAPAPVTSTLEDRLNAMETSFNDKMNRLVGVVETMATAAPQSPIEVAPEAPAPEAPAPVDTSKYGLKTITKKPFKPFIKDAEGNVTARYKNQVNFCVGVVYDSVDKNTHKESVTGQHPCRLALGMTAELATALGRNQIRRRLITTVKGLHKQTQGDDWVQVASQHGITDAVCDEFLTNPQTNQQQARRTAETLRTRLGITNVSTFMEVARATINGDVSPSEAPVSAKPALGATTPAPSGTATVDESRVLELMNKGFTAAQAKDFLNQ